MARPKNKMTREEALDAIRKIERGIEDGTERTRYSFGQKLVYLNALTELLELAKKIAKQLEKGSHEENKQ